VFDRERFKWDVVLIEESADSHRNVERVFESYWSPEYIDEGENGTLFIAEAAAALETFESKRKGKPKMYRPVSAQLQARVSRCASPLAVSSTRTPSVRCSASRSSGPFAGAAVRLDYGPTRGIAVARFW
jgi:hypothetical protein